MKSLATLIRVKQREIDALRRQQEMLLKQREDIHAIIDGLANQLVRELKTAEKMPDMSQFFGDFAAIIKKRQRMMHAHLTRVENEIEKIASQLRDRFSEMKKFELALAAYNKRLAEAAQKRDMQELDEIAITGYNRRHAI